MTVQAVRLGMVLMATVALGACQLGGGKGAKAPTAAPVAGAATAGLAPGETRDVEAPEIFAKTDKALWDGRPSLGGVWVAHASVKDPQRVVMRNPATGKAISGALFRREFDNPGPSLQLSSDAAEALGLLAGQPATIEVVALKRVEAPPPAPAAPAAAATAAVPASAAKAPPPKPGAVPVAGTAAKPKAGQIEQKPLDPVAATAAAAIDAATKAEKLAAKAATAAPAAPAAQAPSAAGAPRKPFLQVGIFSTRENAETSAAQLGKAGFAVQVKENKGDDKTLWRVLIGPMASKADLEAAIARTKAMGYADAYPVSR